MPLLGQVPATYWLGDQTKPFVFQTMGYKIHAQEVLDFHESEAPVRVISAPARTSKSYSTAAEIIALTQPTKPLLDILVWIVGPTYDTNKEFEYVFDWYVTQRDLWTVEGHPLQIERAQNNPANGSMEIVIRLGRDEKGRQCRLVIQGKSSTQERSLQGDEPSVVALSEAAEHPEHIWRKYVSTRYWRAILPTTPKPYAEWIRDMVEEGERDPSLGIEHFRFPPHANPAYNRDRFERERKRAESRSATGRAEDDPYFAEQFLGLWVYYTGMVLPFQDRRQTEAHLGHVVPPLSARDLEGCRIFCSMDYGYRDAAVIHAWAVLPDGQLCVFDEVYERGLDSVDLRDRAEDMLGRYGIDRPDFITGDPSRPEVAGILQKSGWKLPVTMNKNYQRDRAAGHRRLVDLLSLDEALASPQFPQGRPGLVLTENCTKTRAELRHLRYREGSRDEHSTGAYEGDDHAFDSLRYGAMTFVQPRKAPRRDWLREFRQKKRRQWANEHPEAAQLGVSRWAATGANPY